MVLQCLNVLVKTHIKHFVSLIQYLVSTVCYVKTEILTKINQSSWCGYKNLGFLLFDLKHCKLVNTKQYLLYSLDLASPPYTSTDFSELYLAICVQTWAASSRVGSRIIACTPFVSPASALRLINSSSGKRKASVFPVPVRDLAKIQPLFKTFLLYNQFVSINKQSIYCLLHREQFCYILC